MRRLAKFARLPAAERILFVEAALWLGCSRLAIVLVPFRRLAPYLGQHMRESPPQSPAASRALTLQVAGVVKIVSHHLPWKCSCLTKAMAAMALLKRRGLKSTLYLGVARESPDHLCAHAWLRTGDIWVTGGRKRERYAVVGHFMQIP